VFSTVYLDKPWQQVGESYGRVMSPAPDKDGNVFFADTAAAGRIYRSDSAGKVTLFKDGAGNAQGLAMGPDGRLYASQPGRKRIVSYGSGGDEKVVAPNVEATSLAMTAKGGVYYSDAAHRTLGYVEPGKPARVVYNGGEIAVPAGLAISPDQAMLI